MLCFFRVLYVLSFSHFLYFFLRYFFCSVKWLLFNERWQWRKRWKMSSNSKDSPFFICSFFFLFSSNDAHRVFRWIPLEIMFILLLNQISPSKIYKWLLILFHFNLFPFTAVNNLRHKKMLTHYELVYILLAIFNGKVFQKDVDQIECLFKFGFFWQSFCTLWYYPFDFSFIWNLLLDYRLNEKGKKTKWIKLKQLIFHIFNPLLSCFRIPEICCIRIL